MEHLIYDPDGDLVLLLSNRFEDDQQPPPNDTSENIVDESETVLLRDSNINENKEDRATDIHMLVSSKHMKLASRVFKAMLSNNFSEGHALHSSGKLELPLPDDDPAAFKILLNIIHGQPRVVPHQVGLTLCSRLAATIDKYELHEVVEVFSDIWMKHLRNGLPESSTPDLLQWLLIAWVFRQPSEFNHISKILERESTCMIGENLADDLPIPASILEKVNINRQRAICQLVTIIDRTIAEYQESKPHCERRVDRHGDISFECDAMTLGALIKRSREIGIWPAPDPPYDGISFSILVSRIRQMKLPTLCGTIRNLNSQRHYLSESNNAICDVRKTIEPSMRSLEDGLCGLVLDSFTAKV